MHRSSATNSNTELKSFEKIKVNDMQFNFNIVKDPHKSLSSIECAQSALLALGELWQIDLISIRK